MSRLGEWIIAYLNRLRPELRADRNDDRLMSAARAALERGWTPEQMAAAVEQRDYTGGRNLIVLALMRLEQLADQAPATEPERVAPSIGCDECDMGWTDLDDGPTRPCRTCRPQLAARLAQIPPPGQRTPEQITYLRRKRTMR